MHSHWFRSTDEEPEPSATASVRKSSRLGALPTIDRFPARREGIHLPQTREQISAKAEALRKNDLKDRTAKVQQEARQRDDIWALMACKMSSLRPASASVPSSPEPMDVDEEETAQDAIEDAIIDVGSSDIEDAPGPQHLPSPPPDIAPNFANGAGTTNKAEDDTYSPLLDHARTLDKDEDEDEDLSILPDTDTESAQPAAKHTTKTVRKGQLPSKVKVCFGGR
jgi:hypothetical protein